MLRLGPLCDLGSGHQGRPLAKLLDQCGVSGRDCENRHVEGPVAQDERNLGLCLGQRCRRAAGLVERPDRDGRAGQTQHLYRRVQPQEQLRRIGA